LIFLIPRFSYVGASWSTFATETLVTLLMFLVLTRMGRDLPSFRKLQQVALPVLAAALFLYFFRDISLWLALVLGGGIYLALVLLAGAINMREVLELLKKQKG